MVNSSIARIPLVAGVAALLWLAPLPAMGQTAVSAPQAPPLPRTAEGRPDFTGFWQAMNRANDDILPHSASTEGPAGLGVVDGNELPYQAWALARQQENYANRQTLDTEAQCFLPGVPRIMYMPFPFQVVQTPDHILMLFEYVHATRHVYMNEPHPRGPIEWWMGDSRGHWEGDTLVVDVVHLNDQTWFDRTGNFHSEALHVVERYTLMDRDHISYTATVEDSEVFTRPWTLRMVLYRHREPNFQLLDYECYAFDSDEGAGVSPEEDSTVR